MSSKLEYYAALAAKTIKEKLKEFKSTKFEKEPTNTTVLSDERVETTPTDNGLTVEKLQLSSSLQCDKMEVDNLEKTLWKNAIPLSQSLKPGFEKLDHLPTKISKRQLKKQRQQERSMTKGSEWFDLPATEQTEERLNDLKVIQMRGVLDPKRFYKSTDIRPGVLPKYFQTGTVVETAAEFYSSRIPKKQRKKTLVDELMSDAEFKRYKKRKYAEIAAKGPTASQVKKRKTK